MTCCSVYSRWFSIFLFVCPSHYFANVVENQGEKMKEKEPWHQQDGWTRSQCNRPTPPMVLRMFPPCWQGVCERSDHNQTWTLWFLSSNG